MYANPLACPKHICLALYPRTELTLLQLTPATLRQFLLGNRLAVNLKDTCPHQLRHGGASLDGVYGHIDAGIADLGDRRWIKSTPRYRKPAEYFEAFNELTQDQPLRA